MRILPLAIPLFLASTIPSQVPAEEFSVESLPGSRGYALGPKEGATQPDDGWALLVVLPGGPGTPDFLPWVRNVLYGRGAPDDFVAVMLTSVKWNEDQKIVWPVQGDRTRGMEYTTEDYVAAAVEHCKERWKIDDGRVYLLAWSSSGPAAWEIALSEEHPFAGFFVAMSVFAPKRRASLRRAEGQRFFLYQSPDDQVTPMRHAEGAAKDLDRRGATVWLDPYEGGHGWHGDAVTRIRRGLEWLDSDAAPPESGDEEAAAEAAAPGKNLVRNGGFEKGTDSWLVVDNSETFSAEREDGGVEGRHCLHLEKTGRMPLDLVRQEVRKLPRSGKLRVRASVKTEGARNAFVKFFLYGEDDEVLVEDVDVAHLRGDRDWHRIEKTYELDDRARYGVFMVVMVLDGDLWIDAVEITPLR